MTSTGKKNLSLWQFKVVNRHTFQEMPRVLVVGYTMEHARNHVYKQFDRSLYDIVDGMRITNQNFMALCAVLYPDLDDYRTCFGEW